MSTTAQWVFEAAIHLMDAAQPSTGLADCAETREYKARTLAILNVLRCLCLPQSDTCGAPREGKRPLCPEIVNFTDPIGLDDGLCQGVLPYGLAARLLEGEDPDQAARLRARFQEALARAALPASIAPIEDVYGGI